MLKKAALVLGVVLLAVGVLGFVPGITSNGKLLGIFEVNAVHNIIHVLSGIAAILGSKSEAYASLYFKVFGVVYALVTVVGFISGTTVLGLFDVNLADNLLHVLIAGSALYLGFGVKPDASRAV